MSVCATQGFITLNDNSQFTFLFERLPFRKEKIDLVVMLSAFLRVFHFSHQYRVEKCADSGFQATKIEKTATPSFLPYRLHMWMVSPSNICQQLR